MDTTPLAQTGTDFFRGLSSPEGEALYVSRGIDDNGTEESMSSADDADDETPAYTIDELAQLTGVPSRTIRFYQASGAIPGPHRRGRVAYYGQEHVERLGLVASLQDRGLHLKAIRDLVRKAAATDVSVSEWLGVGDQLRAPWSEDRPRVYTTDELTDLVGGRLGVVAELERAGLIVREGDAHPATYVTRSPGLLGIALKLADAGLGVGAASDLTKLLRKRLRSAADDVAEELARGAKRGAGPKELVASVDALRSAGLEAVRLVFAQEMERALRGLVDAGKIVPRADWREDPASRAARKTMEHVQKVARKALARSERAAKRAQRRAERRGRGGEGSG